MKKLSLLLFTMMICNSNAQDISFNKLYSNNDPVNYFLGHYSIPGTDGLQIKWDGGIRLLTNNNSASIFQMLGNGNIEELVLRYHNRN